MKEQEIYGFPVVITDAAPEGEIIFGRFPTEAELMEKSIALRRPYDIWDWIEDRPKQFSIVKGLGDE